MVLSGLVSCLVLFALLPGATRRVGGSYNVGTHVNERETPMVRSPELGYAIAAHRHLKAVCEEMPVATLPRLSRCANTRCVSPYHTHATEAQVPARARGRTRGGAPVMDYVPPAPAPQASIATVELLSTRDISRAKLAFKLFQSSGEHNGSLRLVGAGICLLSSLSAWFAAEQQSLRR